MKKKTQQWFVGIILSLLDCVVRLAAAYGEKPSNSQYIITKDVITAGGGRSQSSTYVNTGSLGQTSPLGRSARDLLVNYGGFWGGGMTHPIYLFTLKKGGTGSGTVTGGGINYDPACSEQSIFCEEHTTIVLHATPAPGSIFVEWLKDGQPVSGNIIVTSDVTITAMFNTIAPNHSPVITSMPPSVEGRLYMYDVEADDPDSDPLTFSLLTAPAGMTIDAQSGLIT